MNLDNIQEAIKLAAAKQLEQRMEALLKADNEIPAEGFYKLRFIGYIEMGIQKEGKYNNNKAQLLFELMDGVERHNPIIISELLSISHHQNSDYFKLLKLMSGEDKSINHFAELLGKPFVGTVVHKIVHKGYFKNTYAQLKNDSGYTIRLPRSYSSLTNREEDIEVDEHKSNIKIFLWDYATREMWDSIFIDGVYPTGKSKNIHQEKILKAENYDNSEVQKLFNIKQQTNITDEELTEIVNDLDGVF